MSLLLFWAFSFWLPPSAPQPRPDLAPAEVVRTVAAALRNYDSPIPNAGVFTAYRFASPANRAVTGPYGHFLRLVKSADFAPMLRGYPSDLGAIEIKDDHAEQILKVHLVAVTTRYSNLVCPGGGKASIVTVGWWMASSVCCRYHDRAQAA